MNFFGEERNKCCVFRMMIVVVSAVNTMVTFNYKMKQIDHDFNYSLYIYYEIITTNNLWNPLKIHPIKRISSHSSSLKSARYSQPHTTPLVNRHKIKPILYIKWDFGYYKCWITMRAVQQHQEKWILGNYAPKRNWQNKETRYCILNYLWFIT